MGNEFLPVGRESASPHSDLDGALSNGQRDSIAGADAPGGAAGPLDTGSSGEGTNANGNRGKGKRRLSLTNTGAVGLAGVVGGVSLNESVSDDNGRLKP